MLVTEPLVTCMAFYASFTYSLIYLTLEIFPIVFREERQWSLMPSSLTFLGILIGVVLAAPMNFLFQPYYKRAVKRNHGKAAAEARLTPLVCGGVLLTTGLFWFAWTAAPKYPWPLPVVAAGKIRLVYPPPPFLSVSLPWIQLYSDHKLNTIHRLYWGWLYFSLPTMLELSRRHIRTLRGKRCLCEHYPPVCACLRSTCCGSTDGPYHGNWSSDKPSRWSFLPSTSSSIVVHEICTNSPTEVEFCCE